MQLSWNVRFKNGSCSNQVSVAEIVYYLFIAIPKINLFKTNRFGIVSNGRSISIKEI